MLADSLTGAREDGDLTANALRQRREVIRRLVTPLASQLGGASVPASRVSAERYVLKIIHDTCARAGFEPECFTRAPFEQILCALELAKLDRLIVTLKERLRSKGFTAR